MTARRRYLTFSLRTLFVLLTVLAIGLGWKVDQAQRRGRAIDAIVEAGGKVQYIDEVEDAPPLWRSPDDDHLRDDLNGVPVVAWLRLPPENAMRVNLSEIYGLSRLTILHEIAPDDLATLKQECPDTKIVIEMIQPWSPGSEVKWTTVKQ